MSEFLSKDTFKEGLRAEKLVELNAAGTSVVGVDAAYDSGALQVKPPPGGWISAMGSVIGAVANPVNGQDALNKQTGDATYAPIVHTHPSTSDFLFTYDSSVTMADPGVGKVRTNTASGTPPTIMAISESTDIGISAANVFASLTVGDLIYFQESAVAGNWGRYKITSAPVDQGTWWQIGIEQVEVHGTAIAKNTLVLMRFTYGAGGSGGGLDQEAADARYLKLTGGALSGEISIPENVTLWLNSAKTIGIKFNSATSAIEFVGPYTSVSFAGKTVNVGLVVEA